MFLIVGLTSHGYFGMSNQVLHLAGPQVSGVMQLQYLFSQLFWEDQGAIRCPPPPGQLLGHGQTLYPVCLVMSSRAELAKQDFQGQAVVGCLLLLCPGQHLGLPYLPSCFPLRSECPTSGVPGNVLWLVF